MKQTTQSFFALVALLSVVQSQAAVPFYSMRSQSVNAAREMVGWEEDINRCNMDHIYGSFNITPEYTSTFRPNNIASCLFGSDLQCSDDCGSSLLIQGSLVADRNSKAWLADYFGLPTDFDGKVTFKPRITNWLVDLNFYLGLDELACGLYFRIHAPIVHTRWDLNTCETSTKGVNDYPAGYFAGDAVPNAGLLGKALDFFSGKSVPTGLTTDNTGNTTLPTSVVFNKLSCSRWAQDCDCSSLSKTRLSDIEFGLGWNFWCNEDYLVGLQLRASAPTGNKPGSCYLFEPIVGSGGHWKLGGALDFHAIFWRNCEETSSFGFYMDANIQHLFDTCQTRCFDLCSSGTVVAGDNSRYMLAQRLQPVPAGQTTFAPANSEGVQFASEFAPVANLTTFNVDVNIAVEADIAIKFAYTNCNFTWDLGYEFYGRSCEKFCAKTTCIPSALDGKTWALKGDSEVFGYAANTATVIPLAATQSGANIHTGTNNFTSSIGANRVNTGIDNGVTTGATAASASATPAQRSSNPVVGLTEANVNFAGTRAITNKIFTHLNYSWRDNEDWTPYLGIGGEVEFAGCGSCNDCNSCDTSCNTSCNPCATTCATTCNTSCDTDCGSRSGSCFRCVPSQWGVWLKGGVSFN